jgi:predicted protein tyrosine phosphatase
LTDELLEIFEFMIFVCPLSGVEDAIKRHRPSHLISLLDPESMIQTPNGIETGCHLQLGMNDISMPVEDMVQPAATHIEELLNFIKGWDQSQPLLVHCWAGISRSTAAAFIALCALNEGHDEEEIAMLIRQEGDHAFPNRLMVRIADDLLNRNGRMCAAIEAMGPARATWEGKLFSLPICPTTTQRRFGD